MRLLSQACRQITSPVLLAVARKTQLLPVLPCVCAFDRSYLVCVCVCSGGVLGLVAVELHKRATPDSAGNQLSSRHRQHGWCNMQALKKYHTLIYTDI